MSSGQLVGLALNTMWDPRTELSGQAWQRHLYLLSHLANYRRLTDSRQLMLEKDFLPDGTTLAESSS